MKQIVVSLGLVVFTATLAFPLSADAFGRRPNSSEVYQAQPSTTTSNNPSGDSPGREYSRVPEPSSIMLLGIGGGLMALVSMRKWLRRAVTK